MGVFASLEICRIFPCLVSLGKGMMAARRISNPFLGMNAKTSPPPCARWLAAARSLLVVACGLLFAGCPAGKPEPPLNEPRSQGTANATRVYTKAELDKLILPGMSVFEVTNTFGSPASRIQVRENDVILAYSFPFETVVREGGPRLTGFDVNIRNGKVLGWSPVMGESRNSFSSGAAQGSFEEQTFQVFVATESLTNIVNTVDSEGSADASNLQGTPDMSFKAKMFSGNMGSERPGELTVILVVSEQDASKLKGLSEDNLGKRMLIVCQNRVLAAPVISVPLTSRQLMFPVKNSGVLDGLRSK